MFEASRSVVRVGMIAVVTLLLFSMLPIAIPRDIIVEGIEERDISPGSWAPTRSSQYYHSSTGGKWVYDFSGIDPLSNSQNLIYSDGVGILKEREELDDFSSGTPGTVPSGWTESDTSEGDFILDASVYDGAPNGALFTSKAGGSDYSVSHSVPTSASSDLLEVMFSLRIDQITEGTSTQGVAIRVHYTGTTDGPELRIHQNGTLSFFGWDGAQNREHFSQGTALINDVWYEIIMNINMTSQSCDLTVDGRKEFWSMPMRASSGGTVLFVNTLTFHTGSVQDTADFYIDDIFATRNTIDSGFYRSPTISKTPNMNWQFLQVYPGDNEDLMSLSLINITSDLPFPPFDSIPVPSNGRIDISSMSNAISNFRIKVDMDRDADRRPSLDLIGASWFDPLQFFDPLFPGTGLQGTDIDFINEGAILHRTGPTSFSSTGQVVTPVIELSGDRVWGEIQSTFDLPSSCNITLEAISPTSANRLLGTFPSYNGTLALTDVHPMEQYRFRIRITLKGDGISTPTINWLAVTTLQNTYPVIDMVSLEKSSIRRMESTNITFRTLDGTDPVVTTGLDYRTSTEGPWIQDMITGRTVEGEFTTFTLSPEAADPVGTYELRLSAWDRRGEITYLQEVYLGVENILVTRPMIALTPGTAFTNNILRTSIITESIDPEDDIVRYRFHWYVNGDLVDPDDPGGPEPGWIPENVSARESTLSPFFTKKGDNVSCVVVPTDLIDDGPAAEAWLAINNSPPRGPDAQLSWVVEEDTAVTIDVLGNFTDFDDDDMGFSLEYPDVLTVEEISHGVYNITPKQNLNGEFLINITATDGPSEASGQVSITYTPLNDPPYILDVPSYTLSQGDPLEIPIFWGDPENTDSTTITVDLPSTWGEDGQCSFDEMNSTIIIKAGNGNVGVHDFQITVRDPQGLEDQVRFNITVKNINDPIEGAIIISPGPGDRFKVGDEVTFEGGVSDPDQIHDQEFFYTWVLVTETIGTGKRINHTFDEPGTYVITLEVSEGTASRSTTVEIIIEEKDNGGGGGGGSGGDDKDGGMNILTIALPIVAVVFIGLLALVVMLLVRGKKKKDKEEEPEATEPEEAMEEPPEPSIDEPEKVQEQPPEPAPIEPETEHEPDIMMPSDEGILMPEDLGEVDIPQVEIPQTATEPTAEDGGSDVEYYSPSNK